uniref:Uncharacterized protein n=1 Tax=Xenopus tropicalis TaxID=8364 RepID=A0A1B8Y8I0_XENTR
MEEVGALKRAFGAMRRGPGATLLLRRRLLCFSRFGFGCLGLCGALCSFRLGGLLSRALSSFGLGGLFSRALGHLLGFGRFGLLGAFGGLCRFLHLLGALCCCRDLLGLFRGLGRLLCRRRWFLGFGRRWLLLGRLLLTLQRLLVQLEGSGGSAPLDLGESPLSDQGLESQLEAAVVPLHIVASGSQSLLESGQGHPAALLRGGHGFHDQFGRAGPGGFLGFSASLLGLLLLGSGGFCRESGLSYGCFCHSNR